MRAALRSSRGCNGESHSKYVVGLDFIDRIVGVSPRHLHARIGLAVLIQTYKHIDLNQMKSIKIQSNQMAGVPVPAGVRLRDPPVSRQLRLSAYTGILGDISVINKKQKKKILA